ncbi:undecaprenyldiphospho-muramoylpentapeptide beta-N-acetylglucosaminyltransferase [Saccharibacillus kuerlensis]|uniref:UDP-N-acetylglucosamine--N-acetylmuramyl-(pentapeptide) pyrophosphoryl-undecaprenol N-acetylglucosamine transferase n=1 Tax=Saccharibacillus kuerlensis TaxID=459527 RepID=A0ABQ2L601_9BACL|nr:undecaprenyldiphospho-muramoylpentapeptide beta-N-acetylglucosaminyltransferase [Saccharibacillus kuerlensis]GGO02828.1 UDP-N-acetylglucosamine--N-acetylmuramyl-(pentapeptide) pyrophosphoryl-undecaprenol N-acetylglucosamine transferase [Saccharibacillus kuerlensis]
MTSTSNVRLYQPKRIVLTGGGSAGHVSVNLALIPVLREQGWSIDYIGSENGIEKELIANLPGVSYHAIATGKLRRYFSLQNFTDPFRILKGVGQSRRLIRRLKPSVVFSKGGFVSVPVVLGAWMNRVPSLIHESDYSPGLANKLALPFASALCTTFPETAASVKSGKAVQIGSVVRPELKSGDAARGLQFLGFTGNKPLLLAAGGSLGSRALNDNLRRNLDALLEQFDIVHLCGRNGLDPQLEDRAGYRQFEYVNEQLPDILAAVDLVFSRAGSNAIFEFLSLGKPMLLCPLGRKQSRGDQLLNADSFVRAGYAEVIDEENWNDAEFLSKLDVLQRKRDLYIARMNAADSGDPLQQLLRQIEETAS